MARRRKVLPEFESFVFGESRTGGFAWHDIRPILSAQKLQDKVFRRASVIQIEDPDRFYRRKKTSAARIESVGDTASQTLMAFVEAFPDFSTLHPFYRDLAATIVDIDGVRQDLGRLQGAAARIQDVCRKSVKQIRRTGKDEFVQLKMREAYGRVGSIIKDLSGALARLEEGRRSLAKIPTLDPGLSTLVVAGIPNVGKSAFVTRVCSAKPQVAPYPFTTQGIIVGQAHLKGRIVQVVDTPGILDRAPEDRNAIEERALAAVRHLGNIVLFLFDPTEGSAQSMKEQESLLKEVRGIFKKRLVVEAENKADVARSKSPRLKISALTGDGVEPLMRHLISLLPDKSGRPGWAADPEAE